MCSFVCLCFYRRKWQVSWLVPGQRLGLLVLHTSTSTQTGQSPPAFLPWTRHSPCWDKRPLSHRWGKRFSRLRDGVEYVSSHLSALGWESDWDASRCDHFPQFLNLTLRPEHRHLSRSPGKRWSVCLHPTNSCPTHLGRLALLSLLLRRHLEFPVTCENNSEHHSLCPEDSGQLPISTLVHTAMGSSLVPRMAGTAVLRPQGQSQRTSSQCWRWSLVPRHSTEPCFWPSDLILKGLHSPATCWRVLAWGMFAAAGCLIKRNLLAMGSSWTSFTVNRANSYIAGANGLSLVLLCKNKMKMVLVLLGAMYLGRWAALDAVQAPHPARLELRPKGLAQKTELAKEPPGEPRCPELQAHLSVHQPLSHVWSPTGLLVLFSANDQMLCRTIAAFSPVLGCWAQVTEPAMFCPTTFVLNFLRISCVN